MIDFSIVFCTPALIALMLSMTMLRSWMSRSGLSRLAPSWSGSICVGEVS